MNPVRLVLSLLFFVSAFALFGAAAWGGDWYGVAVGGLVGLGFELVFGGAGGRWADGLYPPTRK
ncbi:MAG TPA: hypothetical protein VKE74_33600 [Gemmataceae bacterium]|nr:hypothetical protein [Gemmataceae bacterium]